MLRPGKYERKRKLGRVRDLEPEDLPELMAEDKPVQIFAVKRFRDSHHMLARLAAAGLTQVEIARRTGYSINRVHMIHADPAFQELIAHYRGLVTEAWVENVDEFITLATGNMLKAERQIGDRLDQADELDETLPIRELVSISRDAADRFGYGKRQTNLNVNADFASLLDKAIKRTAKVIENSPDLDPPLESREGSSPPARTLPTPITRAVASSGRAEAGSGPDVLSRSPPAIRRRA